MCATDVNVEKKVREMHAATESPRVNRLTMYCIAKTICGLSREPHLDGGKVQSTAVYLDFGARKEPQVVEISGAPTLRRLSKSYRAFGTSSNPSSYYLSRAAASQLPPPRCAGSGLQPSL